MPQRIFTLLFILFFSQIGSTQIINDQVMCELVPYTLWSNVPADGSNNLGEYVIQLEPFIDGESREELCLQWNGLPNVEFNFLQFFWMFEYASDATIDFSMRAWESDDPAMDHCNVVEPSTLFEANASDYTLGIATLKEMGPPSAWLETLGGSNGNWLFNGNGSTFDIKVRGGWKYKDGDTCDQPLQFGTLTDNTTVKNLNANRAMIGNNFGPTPLEYSNTANNESADIFYSFTLEETADVMISTESDATDFDTFIILYEDDCDEAITVNDDFAGNSWSRIDRRLCPGNYLVQVEGHLANTGVFELSINTKPIDDIEIVNQSINPVSCHDANDGSIELLSIAGGVFPYDVVWNTGANSYGISNLELGTYTATVTDACSKEFIVSYDITSGDNVAPNLTCFNTAIGIEFNQTGLISNNTNLDNVFVSDNCTADDVTFAYSPDIIDASFEGINSIICTATDGSGNTATCTFELEVIVSPLSDFSFISTADYSYSFTDESQYTPTSWAWDFGDGESSTMPNPDHTFSGPGLYNVC